MHERRAWDEFIHIDLVSMNLQPILAPDRIRWNCAIT